ncbi:helix-turn-helix domain-containing protein [Flaviramulus sp. BrNp1-15]|uniref:helix-turn-helix domain-containing protein n=1 Tax=Flaviramulus sp. BrNp1-15 TaxID=2916754 RepID=UPI001EE91423|nr:helix-turn-helix domain-containing protein [Flaviramulus sp. BrNp1-15]ULC60016.1 helix-turn-helix domain-containing protein [Flaviramulus sp. BrNp1-15]
MKNQSVSISQIIKETTKKPDSDTYAVCWIKAKVNRIKINGTTYKNVSNSIFFIDPKFNWKIFKKNAKTSSGYILYLTQEVLNNPILSNLHINKVRLFNSGETPLFKLSPGIEKRTQAILEMIDELLGSHLNHKEEAILSLLNTFFVYCDGQCNIKSIASNNNSRTNIVYNFKKLVDKHVIEYHNVSHYAKLLNITPKYLNECVNEVLSTSSKNIIVEQLLMRSRHRLKFSSKSIKEISFELGFSTPDYFSYFFKTHTGYKPSALRKV